LLGRLGGLLLGLLEGRGVGIQLVLILDGGCRGEEGLLVLMLDPGAHQLLMLFRVS